MALDSSASTRLPGLAGATGESQRSTPSQAIVTGHGETQQVQLPPFDEVFGPILAFAMVICTIPTQHVSHSSVAASAEQSASPAKCVRQDGWKEMFGPLAQKLPTPTTMTRPNPCTHHQEMMLQQGRSNHAPNALDHATQNPKRHPRRPKPKGDGPRKNKRDSLRALCSMARIGRRWLP